MKSWLAVLAAFSFLSLTACSSPRGNNAVLSML